MHIHFFFNFDDASFIDHSHALESFVHTSAVYPPPLALPLFVGKMSLTSCIIAHFMHCLCMNIGGSCCKSSSLLSTFLPFSTSVQLMNSEERRYGKKRRKIPNSRRTPRVEFQSSSKPFPSFCPQTLRVLSLFTASSSTALIRPLNILHFHSVSRL